VDVSGEDNQGNLHAAIIVMEVPSFRIRQVACAFWHPSFPYVPGLLSFREIPALAEAFKLVKFRPDMLMVDGQGIAHPRRFGLACHLGVLLGIPSIGCAKTRLIGDYEMPGNSPGDWSPLSDGRDLIGAVLRTRKGVRPLFVSPGSKVDLPSAIEWVIKCGHGYRLPEPTRLAHRAASLMRSNGME
jgi:deoxyribonuclease V